MVCTDVTAVFIAEGANQDFGKGSQQLISFRKSVPGIEQLHAVQVKEKEHCLSALSPDRFLPGLSQLKEISHARKARQVIILVRP